MDAICKCNTVLHRCFDVRPLGTNSLAISAEHSLLKKGQIKKNMYIISFVYFVRFTEKLPLRIIVVKLFQSISRSSVNYMNRI